MRILAWMARRPIRTGGISRAGAVTSVQALTRAGTAPPAPLTHASVVTRVTAAVHVTAVTCALAATHGWRAGLARAGGTAWTRR